ncbi:MAG: DUF4248 domain-containing protein [Bacteroidaceae bacterium]|nr:DUF4248 domain-containing protein [Bacteroidaceae bacterium]
MNINTMKIPPYNPPRPPRRRQCHFGRLALLYYPDRGYKRAVHLFRQELRETRGLYQALQDVGYRGNERILTPRQVQVIEEFLGEA